MEWLTQRYEQFDRDAFFGDASEFLYLGRVVKPPRTQWEFYVAGSNSNGIPDPKDFNGSQQHWAESAKRGDMWSRYTMLIRKGQSTKWTIGNSFVSLDIALAHTRQKMRNTFQKWIGFHTDRDGNRVPNETSIEFVEATDMFNGVKAAPMPVDASLARLVTEVRASIKGGNIKRLNEVRKEVEAALTGAELLSQAQKELVNKLERMMSV
jgi:hypothetical protein